MPKEKEIPCPKFGCRGTLEKCTRELPFGEEKGWGCDECKHFEPINK